MYEATILLRLLPTAHGTSFVAPSRDLFFFLLLGLLHKRSRLAGKLALRLKVEVMKKKKSMHCLSACARPKPKDAQICRD